jgi:Stage III sporulation protein AE (spore_III_AE).
MKKIALFITIFLITAVGVFYYSSNCIVLAADERSVEEQFSDTVDEETDKLNAEGLERFFNSLSEEEKRLFDTESVKSFLKKVTNGEFALSYDEILNAVLATIKTAFIGFLPSLVSIVVISILYGILSSLTSGFLNKQTAEIVYFACYGAIIIILLNSVLSYAKLTVGAVERVKWLSDALFPIVLTVMAALGGSKSVALLQPLLALFSGLAIKLISTVVIPCFLAATVFSIVGNLSKNVRLKRFNSLFITSAGWLLKGIFGLFTFFVTVNGIVGVTLDGAGVKLTKFAVSSYVPLLGGYVGDGLDFVLAGCVVIKNAVGVFGLLLLMTVVLAPIFKLIVFSLCLKLTAALVETVADERLSQLLGDVGKNVRLLVSVLVGVAFMYMLMVMLAVFSANSWS